MKLLMIVIILFLTSCKNEKGFTIEAKITGIPDGTQMMLQNLSTGVYIDSSIVAGNKFRFTGYMDDEPEELRIISGLEELKNGILYYTDLLINNENIRLEADVSDLPYNVNSFGSQIQKEAEIYRKHLYSWNIKIDSLKVILNSLPDSINNPERNRINLEIAETKKSLSEWDTKYLKDNFNSYIALLIYNYRRDFPTDTLSRLYNNLSSELKDSKYGRAIRTQIDYPAPNVGDQYYDFELSDYFDTNFKLSDVKDKYILLQFAGTGCYFSNLSVQHMKEIYEVYSDSIFFVSTFFDPIDKYQNYVEEKDIPWTCLWSPDGKYGEVICKYGVVGTPTFFLVSPEKNIVASWFGFEGDIIEAKIREIKKRKNAP